MWSSLQGYPVETATLGIVGLLIQATTLFPGKPPQCLQAFGDRDPLQRSRLINKKRLRYPQSHTCLISHALDQSFEHSFTSTVLDSEKSKEVLTIIVN